MTSDPADLTAADHLDAARGMAAANRPLLAHLLAEEAARRTADPGHRRQHPRGLPRPGPDPRGDRLTCPPVTTSTP